MSSTAMIEVSGPIESVRSALLSLPGAEPRDPSPRAQVVAVNDQVLLLAYQEAERVTEVLVGGDVPDREALVLFDQLTEILGNQIVVYAADSFNEIARRGDVSAA